MTYANRRESAKFEGFTVYRRISAALTILKGSSGEFPQHAPRVIACALFRGGQFFDGAAILKLRFCHIAVVAIAVRHNCSPWIDNRYALALRVILYRLVLDVIGAVVVVNHVAKKAGSFVFPRLGLFVCLLLFQLATSVP